MIDSTNPRCLADNIRHLAGASESQASEIASLQADIGALVSYSGDEVETGEIWLGNKVYQKVIATMSPNTTDGVYASRVIEFTDLPILMLGIAYTPSRRIPLGYADNSGNMLKVSWSATQGIVVYSSSAGFNSMNIELLVKYIKASAPSALSSPSPDDSRSIEPEVREEAPEEEPIEAEPIEEPVVEVKKTTRKKTTTE